MQQITYGRKVNRSVADRIRSIGERATDAGLVALADEVAALEDRVTYIESALNHIRDALDIDAHHLPDPLRPRLYTPAAEGSL